MDFITDYPTDNVSLLEETTSSYNETTTYFYDEEEDERSKHIKLIVRVSSIIIYSLAFLLGTIGNGLVIFFTAFKMKRTVNVVWFLNLAIADFIFTFFLPLSIAYVSLNFHWPFGRYMCKFNSFLAFINLYASVFLLTVISIDRCISVIFPVWCQNHRSPRLASFVAVVVWILAFIFSLPYFIVREIDDFNDSVVCYNNFHEDENEAYFRHTATVAIRFIIGFLIPFTVIVVCYSVILFRIQRNHMTTSSKPFKVILAVIISFFVCWFPYHVFSFLELPATYGKNEYLFHITSVGIPFTSSLAFINSCVNPVLYVLIGKDFKDKFQRSLRSIFEKAFMEESVQTDLRSKTKSTSDSQLV